MPDNAQAAPVHLRTSLRDFRLALQLDFRAPSIADLWRCGEELERRCAKVESAVIHDDVIADSHRALIAARERRDPLDSLGVRQLRWLPFALFYPLPSPSDWLAADDRVIEEYLRWIEETRNKRALARLLRAFVLNYDQTLATFTLLCSRMRALLDAFDSPRILERRAWAAEHHVLEPDGPRAFSRDWFRRPSSLLERLARFGRDGDIAVSRFIHAVEKVICDDVTKIGRELTEEQFLAAVTALSIKTREGAPRFREPSNGAALANAVLLAFASARPGERLRMAVRQALVDRLGDPRLPGSFAGWSTVSARAVSVFRRWLVDDTLRVFFDVISESVQNSPEQKAQWDARRQFWTAYLDDISDAWVALSPSAAQVARENAALRDIPHGRMEGAGANSVLIMAIDDLLLVEFSHIGGVRYWPPLNQDSAPDLFKEHYRMGDFSVHERFNTPHHGGWQTRVRTIIRNETGVRGNH